MVMQFENQSGGVIQFSEDIINVFQNFRQISDESTESGGVLIGRILLNGLDVVIDQITSPTEGDRATHFSFFRSVHFVKHFILNTWHRSRGTQNYLGEWHTHPENIPNPSYIDIVGWKKMYRNSKAATDELYFVIVGMKVIKVWSLKSDSMTPTELIQKPLLRK